MWPHQTKTVTDRAMVIRSVVDKLEAPSCAHLPPPDHPDQPEEPVKDRPHPASHLTPRAQATQGTLPHQPLRSGGQASGATRNSGPDPGARAAPTGNRT
jgi:hypothetical protein